MVGAYLSSAAWSQQPPSRATFQAVQAPPSRVLAKFSMPRETLKTLYFSIIAYDFHPAQEPDTRYVQLGHVALPVAPDAAWFKNQRFWVTLRTTDGPAGRRLVGGWAPVSRPLGHPGPVTF